VIEKYRTNKSPLKKFLEKKGDEKFNTKPFVAKSDTLFVKLLKLVESADIEDLARLKACGCNIEGNLLLTVRDFPAKVISRWVEMSKQEKENNSYNARGGLRIYSSSVWHYETPHYLVAGVQYKSHEDFLMKSTALGRALL
jgi:hypothetical protein